MYGFEDPLLELATLEKKTGRAMRPPRLIHPVLAYLIYSGVESAARRGGEARGNLASAGVAKSGRNRAREMGRAVEGAG